MSSEIRKRHTDCKVTELFCIIDEFYKHFDAENAGNLLEDNSGVKRRRRAASLSDSETINDMLKNTAQIVQMAWEGGVCTLHSCWIRHSVIPN